MMAAKLGLSSLVEFVPVTLHPLPHYARFDLFAMTSWEDPCPLVVLENMMLGKPVACFADSGGPPEQVGESGLIIPDFSPRLMAEAIADLLRSPDRMAALGAAARDRALANFTDTVQAPKMLAEIDRLVSRHPAGVGGTAGGPVA
jgi:glycosyltransferase involved in cell wall biosynthesis